MAIKMNPHQLKMHNRALSATKRLQAMVGASSDGYWGNNSQDKFIDNGMNIGFDWDKLRSYFGPFSQPQVNSLLALLAAFNEYDDAAVKPAYVAYMLATAWHETDKTMEPIEEYGKGKGRKYGKKIDYDGTYYQGLPHIYYGRGYVQLTWLKNYVKMRELLGVDFVNHPELTMEYKNAANIMIKGMLGGLFTGASLSGSIHYGLYFEFIAARRIINGTDKDDTIADYAVNFLDCLIVIENSK